MTGESLRTPFRDTIAHFWTPSTRLCSDMILSGSLAIFAGERSTLPEAIEHQSIARMSGSFGVITIIGPLSRCLKEQWSREWFRSKDSRSGSITTP